MDRELAEAVWKRWISGEPVSEGFLYKAASLLSGSRKKAQAVLDYARLLTKNAQDVGTPPQPGQAVEVPQVPQQAQTQQPAPGGDPLDVQPPDQEGAMPADQAPPDAQGMAPEDQGPSPQEMEAMLGQMKPEEKIQAVMPELPKELVKRYGKQLQQAEEQMGVPVTDPMMLQKFIEEFKNADLELQKAFLKNFRDTSKAFYSGQQALGQGADQGAAQGQQIGASSSAPQ